MTQPAPSPQQLAARLDGLASHMLDVAAELGCYGGFDPNAHHRAAELAGAAAITSGWARRLRGEQEHTDDGDQNNT